MSKDLWFAEMERLMYEGASYEQASDRAYDSMRERLFDAADNMRKRAREEPPLPESADRASNETPSVTLESRHEQ